MGFWKRGDVSSDVMKGVVMKMDVMERICAVSEEN